MLKCTICNYRFMMGDMVRSHGYVCINCMGSERENMPNIKITAEVDGKQVPLETVSTETFEAIKALEKPKEIPVARWATCDNSPRLLFKPALDLDLKVG